MMCNPLFKKFALGVMVASVVSVMGIVNADDAVMSTLSAELSKTIGAEPDQIKETPVAGVYQAMFGMEILYASADGRYIFSGDLIDASGRRNLTEDARSTLRQEAIGQLDPAQSVEFKATGEEKHIIGIFTDIDCGFCVRQHQEVPALNEAGVTVRYYGYPRAGINSPSYQKLVNVWCADDQQDAMNRSKAGETLENKSCDNPVAQDFLFGQQLGVSGTPALFTEDGTLVPGYRQAAELVQLLDDLKSPTQVIGSR